MNKPKADQKPTRAKLKDCRFFDDGFCEYTRMHCDPTDCHARFPIFTNCKKCKSQIEQETARRIKAEIEKNVPLEPHDVECMNHGVIKPMENCEECIVVNFCAWFNWQQFWKEKYGL